MKKLIIALLVLVGLVAIAPKHVHDENCGYDPETEEGCTYEEPGGLIKPNDWMDGGL